MCSIVSPRDLAKNKQMAAAFPKKEDQPSNRVMHWGSLSQQQGGAFDLSGHPRRLVFAMNDTGAAP
jgi:hypothetical protein